MTRQQCYEQLITRMSLPANSGRNNVAMLDKSDYSICWHIRRMKAFLNCFDGIEKNKGNLMESDFDVSYKTVCRLLDEQGWE